MRLTPLGSPPSSEILQAIRLELGEVPELFLVLARDPASLRAVWQLLSLTLFHPGRIPRTTKELIALAAVSQARVDPLRDLFRRWLEERGVDEQVLTDLQRDGKTSRLPDRTRELLGLARRAALQPNMLSSADFTHLRKKGLDDDELAELCTTAGAIALLINMARSLGW